jgi:hypothetical protein
MKNGKTTKKGGSKAMSDIFLHDTTNGTSMKVNKKIATDLIRSMYPAPVLVETIATMVEEIENGHSLSAGGWVLLGQRTIERQRIESLPVPLENFYITWHENHYQAPFRWRGIVWWRLGPYSTGIDGDDKEDVKRQLIVKLKKEFNRS